MGNEQKLENLKQLINSSVMLSVQEKEEWLSLVDLMNDKQMSELLTLLGQKPETPAKDKSVPQGAMQGTSPNASAVPASPSLSHISNLPNVMNGSAIPSRSISPPPTAAQRILARPDNVVAPAAAVVPPTTALASPASREGVLPVVTKQSSQPATTIAEKQPVGAGPVVMQVPQEASTTTVELLRKNGIGAISEALKNLVISYGFFSVMEAFEQSPLYSAYIKAGENILSGKPVAGEQLLTTQEFEMIADMMQSLRINRLQ